jgi:hypothetical protein
MTLFLRVARLGLGAALAALATPACYPDGGAGTAPPPSTFYFPTGLAVSAGGNVLYAVNSDFDLQWNGGTLQSYNLFQIRQDTAALVQANLMGMAPPPNIPFLSPWTFISGPDGGLIDPCPNNTAIPANNGDGLGVLLGTACAPPVDSTQYVRDSATIGAFATDLQLATNGGSRIFAPVSGNATITWADVAYDDPTAAPPQPSDTAATFAPFSMNCGARSDGRCDANHQTGNDPSSLANTRGSTLPGEPFGLAQSQDGSVMVVTSETATESSLLTTGLGASAVVAPQPTMQFVMTGMPNGGVGLASIPHDPNAGSPLCEDVGDQAGCVQQAFLETNRTTPEVDLLRYYDDDGSTIYRPYLQREGATPINSNTSGSDSRGIAIDPTPRIQCELEGLDTMQNCARLPARVFIASRTPASIMVGELGVLSANGDNTYDPDQLVLIGNVPLTNGPSNVYLAPIVMADQNGVARYYLRVFVVCFDSNSIFVYDPASLMSLNAQPEAIIYTGLGPYALAFDPFSLSDVATNAAVPIDSRQPASLALRSYRFAYLASFTRSYMQVIDLDDSAASTDTFESIVFTLGTPTPPKGT